MMSRRFRIPTCSLLTLLSIATCVRAAEPPRSDDWRAAAASYEYGPMGAVAGIGEVFINRRTARGDQLVWRGDLVATAPGARAAVMLNLGGQLALGEGTAVRISEGVIATEGGTRAPILIASLVAGDVVVRLGSQTSAYIEAGGSAFRSTPGAAFRIAVSGSGAVAEASVGEVLAEAPPFLPNCLLSRVRKDVRTGRLVPVTKDINLAKKGVEQIQLLLICDGKPVSGRQIDFLIRPPIGHFHAQTFNTTTDADGIATANFTAGDAVARGQIIATAPGLDVEWISEVTIHGFWTLPKKLAVVAAVGGGVIVCAVKCRPGSGLTTVPPPIFIP
ncbi:MAG TPA: hypothetical protein VJH03_27240 [Blastocatellia bacterium]|nr:hypothetical protein [Blastocatellia bacterium]